MAGAGGALIGFVGILAMSAAMILGLSEFIGMTASALVVGFIYIALAVIGIQFFIAPFKSSDEEIDQLEHATADALADLPFDTIKALVEKRPFTAISVAALAGYAATRDPDNAIKNAERMFMGFL